MFPPAPVFLLQRPGQGWDAPTTHRPWPNIRKSMSEKVVTPPAPSHAPASVAPDEVWENERVARTLDGDATAFGELVQRYSTRIHTHLYRMVGSREDAEDLAQEAFVRAFRFLGRFDPARPFRSWLYAIATNVGLNGLRARRKHGGTVRLDQIRGKGSAGLEPVAGGEDGVARVARNELAARVSVVLGQLPAKSAALVHLHYREGMTVAEAAEIVGMREGTARVALHRARQTLRRMLIEED